MARMIRETILTNAVVDVSDQTITEYLEDGVVVHGVQDLLRQWDGLENVSLSIRQDVFVSEPEAKE